MSLLLGCDGDGPDCLLTMANPTDWITVQGLDINDLHFCGVPCLARFAQQCAKATGDGDALEPLEPPC